MLGKTGSSIENNTKEKEKEDKEHWHIFNVYILNHEKSALHGGHIRVYFTMTYLCFSVGSKRK